MGPQLEDIHERERERSCDEHMWSAERRGGEGDCSGRKRDGSG